MIDNSNDSNEILSRYESLFDFAQRELKLWYTCNCFPQIALENIKTLQDKINNKVFNLRNASQNNFGSNSKLSSNYEKHLTLHDENITFLFPKLHPNRV